MNLLVARKLVGRKRMSNAEVWISSVKGHVEDS